MSDVQTRYPHGFITEAPWTPSVVERLWLLRDHVPDCVNPPAALLFQLDYEAPPTVIERLCDRLGVRVWHDPHATAAAELSVEASGQPTIRVRMGDPFSRRRFAVAHELGHLFLHPHLPLPHRDEAPPDEGYHYQLVEKEAHQFAADLLMPARLVRAEVDRQRRDLESLAVLFAVSRSAMAAQLRALRVRVREVRR